MSDNFIKEYRKSLQEMYDLGYGHGYNQAKRDAEIEKLKEQLANIRKEATK